MRALIRQHPLASYLTLAFAISWGGILAVIGGGAIPAPEQEAQRLFPLVYVAMLAGPTFAALLVTAASGAEGLRAPGRRAMLVRAAPRWWAVALLTAPVLLLVTMLAASPVVPSLVPGPLLTLDPAGPLHAADRTSALLFGLLVGVGAGVFEELGWTGVATPALRARHGVLGTGVLLGVAWGAWHFLAVLWGSDGALGDVGIVPFLAASLFTMLPPYRVLMTWVHERTHSLVVAMAMHAALTTSSLLLAPSLTGRALVTFNLAFAAVLWAAVLAARFLDFGVAEDAARTRALRRVKLFHTAIWFVLAACVVAIPVAAAAGALGWAALLIGIVLVEVTVLALNGWRCPLTDVAARHTEARAPNFDIYLPAWLAKWNKAIFGTAFVLGVMQTVGTWLGWLGDVAG